MIVSHQHRFIFMHGMKTAGSSITANLAPWLGPRDTLVGIWGSARSRGGGYNRRARLILAVCGWRMAAASVKQSILQRRPVSKFGHNRANSEIARFYKKHAGFEPYPFHPYAADVRRYIGGGNWDAYYKFTIVRNPWDHAVSYYYWQLKNRGTSSEAVSFKEWLRRFHDPQRPDPENVRAPIDTNWPIYTINDEMAV